MYAMYVMSVRGCVMYVKHVMYVAYVTFVMYVMECGAITQCKRRIADTSQVTARPSSQLAHMLRAQARKLECGRHRNLGAHCNHQSQNNRGIANCGETVIATCAHLASEEVPTHCKLRCDRHRFIWQAHLIC